MWFPIVFILSFSVITMPQCVLCDERKVSMRQHLEKTHQIVDPDIRAILQVAIVGVPLLHQRTQLQKALLGGNSTWKKLAKSDDFTDKLIQ